MAEAQVHQCETADVAKQAKYGLARYAIRRPGDGIGYVLVEIFIRAVDEKKFNSGFQWSTYKFHSIS